MMVQSDHDEERLARIDHLLETLQCETAALRVDTAILAAVPAVVTREPRLRGRTGKDRRRGRQKR
jgi:hypothetical protein